MYKYNLLKSEVKKAEKTANIYSGRNDAKITGYSWKRDYLNDVEFGIVRCEICYNYEERADFDVELIIPMFDRRGSKARVI